MRSASSGAIARPRPAPWASSLEVKKGSKMCGMVWRWMPRPESETVEADLAVDRAAATLMRVPGGVCTRALSIRIRRTWATRSGSQSTSMRSPSKCSSMLVSWRVTAGVNSATTSRASSPRSVGSGRSSSCPASSRERSSSSVASLPRRSTCPRTWSMNWRRVSSSSSSSASSSRKPPSEKIGVRSSCDAVAMNCSRATLQRAELALHVVEGAGEVAQLVVALGRGCGSRSRRRDPAGGALEALARARRARGRRGSRRATATISATAPARSRRLRMNATFSATSSRSSENTTTFATSPFTGRRAASPTSAMRPRAVGSVSARLAARAGRLLRDREGRVVGIGRGLESATGEQQPPFGAVGDVDQRHARA